MAIGGFSFGVQMPQTTRPREYGYDFRTGKWGWGQSGPGGFTLSGGSGTASQPNVGQTIQDIINKGTAAVPEPLRELSKLTTNTLTSTAAVSAPVQGAADKTADYISQLVGQGNPDYTGQRVEALSAPEKQSMEQLQAMTRGEGPAAAGTAAMTRALENTDTSALTRAAGPIQAQKLPDVDISKYINPALGAEYDAILRGNDVQKNAIRARQAKAGAFGANSDVAQSLADESTKRQLALAGSDAFKIAQAAAQGDVSAENAVRESNRGAAMGAESNALGARLTDAQRALTGGQALTDTALRTNAANATAGANARSVGQAGLDANWQQYLAKLGYGLQLPGAAAGALGSLPGLKTVSTEQLGPSAAGQQIGALIGLTGLMDQYGTNTRPPGQYITNNAASPTVAR